ncbi:MAG: TfoX/Sxy family protein [Pseudomonadota bacterium]
MVEEQALLPMRVALTGVSGVTEKRMMGGVCFLVNGNMLGGVNKDRYMFRVGKELEAEALARPGAEPMVHGGRRMGGLVWVDRAACQESALDGWVALALRFAGELPPK